MECFGDMIKSFDIRFRDQIKIIIRKRLISYSTTQPSEYIHPNFQSIQNIILESVYHDISSLYLQGDKNNEQQEKEEKKEVQLTEMISQLNVNVDEFTNKELARSKNLLHKCRRCLIQGKSDEEARNVSSAYILPRGDEIGIDKLTCNTCGSQWVN